MGVPPPPLGGLVISGFFLGHFLSLFETLKYQPMCHETDSVWYSEQDYGQQGCPLLERREKGLSMNNIWKSTTQWSILVTNPTKSNPIKKNIEQ